MAYVTSPYAPRARREAITLVLKHGVSVAEAARRTGVHRSTVYRWIWKARRLELHGSAFVPTLSSASWTHSNALAPEIVAAIVAERERTRRCAEVVHFELTSRGIQVSLSSVKRTIRRKGLTRLTSKWKRYRPVVARPPATHPGSYAQIDTIHFARYDKSKFYVYTLIDIYSRGAYAEYSLTCNQRASYRFTLRAQDYLGLTLTMIQADNGPEFQHWFHDQLQAKGITLRHSRIRQSNDNAYIERFNRTIQDECLSSHPKEQTVQVRLTPYLNFYNNERPHLGINFQTPGELLPRR